MVRSNLSDSARSEASRKILLALRTANQIADNTKEAEWYRVMGYLAQTLDGLLSNVNQVESDIHWAN